MSPLQVERTSGRYPVRILTGAGGLLTEGTFDPFGVRQGVLYTDGPLPAGAYVLEFAGDRPWEVEITNEWSEFSKSVTVSGRGPRPV